MTERAEQPHTVMPTVGVRGEAAEVSGGTSWLAGNLPMLVFALYVAVAFPVIVFSIGRHQWFFGDEWSFLAERDGANLGDLFRSHAEHWSTIPIVVYRILFNAFALRSYLPYQAIVAIVHLTTAVLLRVIMRRAGVRPWTATIVASVFVLFGPGQENIVWAFQIGFVGALMFGLVQVILSDHDGRIDKRDALGLVAGAAGLMCSGVSLVMVAVVGLAALFRRGPKVAAFHTVPLAVMYGTWFIVTDPGGIANPYGRGATFTELRRFVWSGERGAFEAIGGHRPMGLMLAIVLVVGTVLIARDRDGRRLRAKVAPFAMLVGALVFLVGTGYTRWFITPTADGQSRYVYTIAALTLPALAVATDALIQRVRIIAPVVLALFLVGIVTNMDDFGNPVFWSANFQRAEKHMVLAFAYSEDARQVPGYVRPNPWYSIGWLRDVAAAGELPAGGDVEPALARQVSLVLSVAQLRGSAPERSCTPVQTNTTLRPAKGARFGFRFEAKPKVGASYFAQNTIVVSELGERDVAVSSVRLKSDLGESFEVERDGLTLRVQAVDPSQRLVICSA